MPYVKLKKLIEESKRLHRDWCKRMRSLGNCHISLLKSVS